MQHVSGSSWRLEAYYSQFIGTDNALAPLAIDRPAAHQQYIKIENLEIKVTAPLTDSQDSETKEFETTGSATIYAGLIPNKGDMFTADVGDGALGLFTITESIRRTHLRNSVFEVSYKLVGHLTPVQRSNLELKTIKTTRFVRELLYYDSNAHLLADDYAYRLDLLGSSKRVLDMYVRDFFSEEHSTFILPGQAEPTYDPWITKFIQSVFSVSEHHKLQTLKLPAVDLPEYQNTTFWDCLLEGSDFNLPYAQYQMRAITTTPFRDFTRAGGIYYTRIRRVLYPFDGRTDTDRSHALNSGTGGADCGCGSTGSTRYSPATARETGTSIVESGSRPGSVDITKQFTVLELNGLWTIGDVMPHFEDRPDFIPVLSDDSYVFSASFYRGEPVSNLERVILDVLRGQSPNREIVKRLFDLIHKLPQLERFYYTPVLLAIAKVILRTN